MNSDINTVDAQVLPASHPLQDGRTSSSPLVTSYQGLRGPVTPVWFMRQAGRSLPEYRSLRIGTEMLDACLDPAMASEITLQPVRRHGVDAAIFFSDIVVPMKLAGVDVTIVPGRGPVLAHPVRTAADVRALPALDEAALSPIAEAVALTVAALGDTPLIGFAGAPFTLAAYLVEGGPSKDHLAARTLMHSDPAAWAELMEWTATITGAFLRAQIMAGASAAQLFDSWAGALSLADYTSKVAPASAQALSGVHGLGYTNASSSPAGDPRTVPIVHFGVGTGELLKAMHDVGADVVGVDYRIPLDEASRRLGGTVPIQGNIDPALLAAPWPVLEAHVVDVLERGLAAPAHVLNLGHGVPPETDPAVLTRLVEFVHARSADA
ncbi:uroporphyrinogen decarboxylase [Subtercola frigoramans]|uniref:Uroporphyrinogen decarboxylase n=1 Tax=Subtercola frigoramans TaxID=120298 RepID=A0ABS2L9G2_9MICO|nr:uroporphyrinogen decarboxylase [Subtercola frigoramans]MBM7473727.1 uroporphyrinogen decarboxylase [Subtercola frigoramans]